MEENRIRAVILGIPGVGKTTIISEVENILQKRGVEAETVVFGSLMFEEAEKRGIKTRDDMRKLPIEDQRNLQNGAAKRIAEMRRRVVIIDTHLFVKTSEWYYPGIPVNVTNIIRPTHLLLIIANPREILIRRQSDTARHRDLSTESEIQHEVDVSKTMIISSANMTSSPFTILENQKDQATKVAQDIVRLLVN
ncbi:MAG TPA: adenylate kinase [Nitrososphaeraceae archaeon]